MEITRPARHPQSHWSAVFFAFDAADYSVIYTQVSSRSRTCSKHCDESGKVEKCTVDRFDGVCRFCQNKRSCTQVSPPSSHSATLQGREINLKCLNLLHPDPFIILPCLLCYTDVRSHPKGSASCAGTVVYK